MAKALKTLRKTLKFKDFFKNFQGSNAIFLSIYWHSMARTIVAGSENWHAKKNWQNMHCKTWAMNSKWAWACRKSPTWITKQVRPKILSKLEKSGSLNVLAHLYLFANSKIMNTASTDFAFCIADDALALSLPWRPACSSTVSHGPQPQVLPACNCLQSGQDDREDDHNSFINRCSFSPHLMTCK